jgi:hypothetical protein
MATALSLHHMLVRMDTLTIHCYRYQRWALHHNSTIRCPALPLALCVTLEWQHACVALVALHSNISWEWRHVCVALLRVSAAQLVAIYERTTTAARLCSYLEVVRGTAFWPPGFTLIRPFTRWNLSLLRRRVFESACHRCICLVLRSCDQLLINGCDQDTSI